MNASSRIEKNLLSTIGEKFPSISIESYELIESGWDNHVIVVNNEVAFKIPRNQENANLLHREVAVTKCMSGSPVRVPDFTLESDPGIGYIAGYSFIQGRKLNSINTLPETMRMQLSDFLNFLFSTHVQECLTGVLGPASEEEWAEKYNEYKETVFSNLYDILSDETLSILASKFGVFQADLSTLSVSPIHGDLYRGNVIIDETGNEIKGIIDWGTACFGDPAIDFAALAVDFPFNYIEDIISRYKGRMDKNFKRRMDFYWQLEPTYGIMYFRDKDPHSHEMLVKELERRLKSGLF